jgi:hypothetical protein
LRIHIFIFVCEETFSCSYFTLYFIRSTSVDLSHEDTASI